MSDKADQIYLSIDSDAVPILWTCVKHLEPIAKKRNEHERAKRLLDKLAEVMADNSPPPWGTLLSLSYEEGFDLDFALHMTITNAEMAREFGEPADQYIGKVKLSSLVTIYH